MINWEYYTTLYPTDQREDYTRLLDDATLTLSLLTAGRAEAIAGGDPRRSRVERCLAELLHRRIVGEAMEGRRGIRAITNDGYSESYAPTGEGGEWEALRGIARHWLCGTGLVSAL